MAEEGHHQDLQLTDEDQAALAPMPPEQRAATLEYLDRSREALMRLRVECGDSAQQLERITDEILLPNLDLQPDQRSRECFTDLLMGVSLMAEASRAMAKGDMETAREHM